MINYKARPALLTKAALEFFKNKRILTPSEFDFALDLDDTDLVSMKMVTRLLDTMEKDVNSNYSYFDLFDYFSFRVIEFFKPLLCEATTPLERLSCFYSVYQGCMASVDWRLEEDETSLTLLANRGCQIASSKYDDLILFCFITKLISYDIENNQTSIRICLPFERCFYKPFLELFENTSFSNEEFSFSIIKQKNQITHRIDSFKTKSELPIINQVIAAANMIPIDKLDLTSLAFSLSMSNRNLQRTLQKGNLHPNEIIQLVKINYAKRKLITNKGNVKETAYQCGYHDQSKLTRLFLNNTGVSPKEWFKQQ